MAWRRRIARDLKELSDGGFPVTSEYGSDDYKLDVFMTTVTGPLDSPYAGCVWKVRFTIPEGFPFTSPSVGFVQRIYHPNIDEESGSICLDALNKAWSPTFTIKHIVETVLPYLLNYPNPDDPLNREAAHLMKTNLNGFNLKAKQHSKANCKSVV
jgi:ubiquitin-conjugating enzyme E2 H